MGEFVDKNILFDIMIEVRADRLDPTIAVDQVFDVLKSLHGSSSVNNGKIIYKPNNMAYLNYVDRFDGSVIKISEGGAGLDKSMRMAILEDLNIWETRVGEQIEEMVNEALDVLEVHEKAPILEHLVNGTKISKILTNNKISTRKYYKLRRTVYMLIRHRFNFDPLYHEEAIIKALYENFKKRGTSINENHCQVYFENKFAQFEWEKSFF